MDEVRKQEQGYRYVGIVYKSGEIFHPNFVEQFRESYRTATAACLVNAEMSQFDRN